MSSTSQSVRLGLGGIIITQPSTTSTVIVTPKMGNRYYLVLLLLLRFGGNRNPFLRVGVHEVHDACELATGVTRLRTRIVPALLG